MKESLQIRLKQHKICNDVFFTQFKLFRRIYGGIWFKYSCLEYIDTEIVKYSLWSKLTEIELKDIMHDKNRIYRLDKTETYKETGNDTRLKIIKNIFRL